MVSSTGSPTTVLHKDEIAGILAARANRPLILVDIAVPRDIAPDVEELENVYLYNIDHLEAIVRENSRTAGTGTFQVQRNHRPARGGVDGEIESAAHRPAGCRRGIGAGLDLVRGGDMNETATAKTQKITPTIVNPDKITNL